MKKYVVYIFLLYICVNASSQPDEIGGVVNDYWQVTDVTDDYAELSAAPDLQPGDKVILMQMTGVLTSDTITGNRAFKNYQNAGRFEMLAVDSVAAGNLVYFTVKIDASNYSTDEKLQLVKIYEADYATVTSPLKAKEWDDDATGGVIALVIFKKLVLSDSINASYSGFRGGQPESGYSGGCRNLDPDIFYFETAVNGIAGSKGEGIIADSVGSVYTKGPGWLVSGGGGGLGYFAGGAGGSNFGYGGNGGGQTLGCSINKNARGGMAMDELYDKDGRITMGGGGGSSTQDLPANAATKGGDGGGIIIIMTDTLVGNNRYIQSSGESVAGTATAGAGGGGAGGSIFLDVGYYSGNLNLDVRGGEGGSTGPELTGAGGGGGGGIIWYTGSGLPGHVTTNVSRGDGGSAENPILTGNNGQAGTTKGNLQLPLNGFLFNTIDGPDTICEGQKPELLLGSMPRGKSSAYGYKWLQSTDSTNWSTAIGTDDSLFFQPDELDTTTWFTRVVYDTIIPTDPAKYVRDTAFAVKVWVYPALANNTIAVHDTLCPGQSPPGVLTGTPVSGGDGTYAYEWNSRTGGSGWGGSISSDSILTEGMLDETTFYRRIVSSHGVCFDTSNVDSIKVLDPVENNSFTLYQDTAICYDQDAGVITAATAGELGGGDGIYTFRWLQSNNGINYSVIAGATSADYPVGVLTADMYYKRVVYSGAGAACKDTTPAFLVNVWDTITNDYIMGSGIQYACLNTGKLLEGSPPQGGSQSYNYIWQRSDDGTVWSNTDGQAIDYTSSPLTDSLYFRRIVHSGQHAQCKDTSAAVLVRINPLPDGDLVPGIDTLCEQEILTVSYRVSGNGPWTLSVGNDAGTELYGEVVTEPSGEISFEVSSSDSVRMLSIRDDSLCYADSSDFDSVVVLTVYNYPVAGAGDDIEVCGLSATLGAEQPPEGSSGLWSSSSGEVSFDQPADPETIVSATRYDTYTLEWTVTNWQCVDDSAVSVTFYQQPAETNAGEDQDLDYRFTTTLDAQPPDVGQGYWQVLSGSGIFEDSTLFNTRVDDLLLGTNELRWAVANGVCDTVRSTVTVTVGDLEVFTGFSPNGDGVNDEFILNMSGRFTSKLIILNQRGRLVFETEGTDQLIWNGENKHGDQVPVGTYFYIIKEEGLPDRTGYIELRK
ncbi:MAG: gliding motility-associated C-terminal domain-containing protein [Bacteroidales bacterium]